MTYSILVTLLALAATLFAVRAYRWGAAQRKRAVAAEEARDAARAAGRKSAEASLTHAVAAEKAERLAADLMLSVELLYDELDLAERTLGVHPLAVKG